MFPAPSPNSQALLQQLQSGGATPSTIEFHRTALAAKKNAGNGPTSNANDQEPTSNPTMDANPPTATDFTQHDAADAANGLFMLAKGGQANNMQMNQAAAMQNETRAAARRVSQNNNGAHAREMSGDGSEQELSKPKGKGKKHAPKANATNNRRKADEAAAKGPNKKAKMTESPSDDSEDEEMRNSNMDPKKMTDEEKRRNFLERNRYVNLRVPTA
jgi:ATF/CREB family transcription factor